MHFSIIAAALAAFHVTSTLAAVAQDIDGRDLEERAVKPRKCGSTSPPPEILDSARVLSNDPATLDAAAAHAPIVVDLYFHVVTSTAKQGRYTQTQLNNQVRHHPPHGQCDVPRTPYLH